MKDFFITVIGATGSGKTGFALALAQFFPVEIINADIGQMYQPFTVGVAQPTTQERSVCPHHLFQELNQPLDFSVVEYRSRVSRLCEEIWERNRIPVFVGGSTLYQHALFFESLTKKSSSSSSVYHQLTDIDNASLWEQLFLIDPARALAIHKNDAYRLQRALTVWYQTGVKPSLLAPRFSPISAKGLAVFLEWPREKLYDRINKRTEEMLRLGWVDEVRALSVQWKDFALHKGLLGYRELIEVLDVQPDATLDFINASCLSVIQQKTRNYAKRQETFFRKLQHQVAANLPNQTLVCDLTLSDLNLYIKQIKLIYESLK